LDKKNIKQIMDQFDRAEILEEQARIIAIEKALEEKETIKFTGKCLCCEEPLAPPLRWCDSDCRDDWQIERDRKARLKAVRSW